MKYILSVLFLFFFFSGFTQIYQEMPQYGYRANRMAFDSTLQIPTVCGVPTLKSVVSVNKKAAIAFDSCNNKFYTYNPKTLTWSEVSGGGATPTLQDVTNIGDSTNNQIIINNNNNYGFSHKSNDVLGIRTYVSNDDNESSIEVYSPNDNTVKSLYTQASIQYTQSGNKTSIGYETPTQLNNIIMPNASGWLALKVNGHFADSAGSINIPTIDTSNKFVNNIYRTSGVDSIYYRIGSTTYAIKDSVGSGGGGGGGGKIYYFNGGVNLGTFGGITMYELGDTAITGTAANFTRATTGNIANFITDVNKPGLLQIPAGVWTIDAFLSETGGGSNHAQIYALLEKWNGSTITTIATSPVEEITNGSSIDLYTYAISVPTTTISATDRIIIQFYIQNTNGKTVTLYTQNGYVGEVHTTFTTGIGALNGLTASTQTFATGTSGTDFNISSATSTHTFNLPTASATNRGALSSANWSTFNSKLGASDTVSLSNRINLKLNISDTANKWVNNISRTVGKDSIIFNIGSTRYAIKDSVGSGTAYTFSTGLTNSSGTITSNLSTGVSGGQSVVGGTAASNSLTLSSTSNATKGKILFGTSAYFENNNRLGINTSTDAGFALDVNGTARVQGDLTSTGVVKSTSGNVTAQFNAYSPATNFPRAQFQIGENSSDGNVGMTIAPLYSSSGVQKPSFIQVSTNKNTTDAGQFGGTLICSTTAFNISSAKADGTVSGGVPITLSPASTEAMRLNTSGNIQFPATNTASGTTGNQTINKTSGTVNIAAAGTTVTVTNSLVTASSIVYAVIRTNDATATIKNVVPAAGSFVINLGAATTAETSIGFFVIN